MTVPRILWVLSALIACAGTYALVLERRVAGPAQSSVDAFFWVVGTILFATSPWAIYLARNQFGFPVVRVIGYEVSPDAMGKALAIFGAVAFLMIVLGSILSNASVSPFASPTR